MTEENKKSNSELLKEIWDAQGKLNKVVGIDTIAIGERGVDNAILEDFLDEAVNELFECKENIMHKWWVKEVKENKDNRFNIMDLAKVKLELIDVLHFITSAAHISRFSFPVFCNELYQKGNISDKKRDFYFLLNRLISNCINKEISYIFVNFFTACKFVGMDIQEIHKIYFMKNKVNLERQANNYAVATKTEDDNHKIEEQIKENDTKNVKPRGKCKK